MRFMNKQENLNTKTNQMKFKVDQILEVKSLDGESVVPLAPIGIKVIVGVIDESDKTYYCMIIDGVFSGMRQWIQECDLKATS